jgi:hypothetical protein
LNTSRGNQTVNGAGEKKLIFLHIPKTAGTTLKTIIGRQYQPFEIAKCYYHAPGRTLAGALDRLRSFSPEQAAGIRIIVGHVGYGLHEHLGWPSDYFTMLREPVERVISSYYQTRRARNDSLKNEAQRLSLRDFVASGLRTALDNGQTRMLSGAAVEEDLLGKKVPYGQCNREMLERAQSNLNKFVAVGISERFDESLMVFKRALGWTNIYYVKANVGRNKTPRQEISKDTLKCIERYNELDLELYERARKLFDERIKLLGSDFTRRMGSYRLLNRTYGGARRVVSAIGKLARTN